MSALTDVPGGGSDDLYAGVSLPWFFNIQEEIEDDDAELESSLGLPSVARTHRNQLVRSSYDGHSSTGTQRASTERAWRSARGHHSAISLSCDPAAHTEDRQASMSTSSYRPAPLTFRPMAPRRAPQSPYCPIAHPRPPTHNDKVTQASSLSWYPYSPYSSRCDENQDRVSTGKATHFLFGSDVVKSRESEHTHQYRPAAPAFHAKIAKPTAMNLPHFESFKQSENTRDLEVDPFRANTASVLAMRTSPIRRRTVNALTPLSVHAASLTSNDFQPMEQRSFTPSQLLALQRFNKLVVPRLQESSIFHKDSKDEFQTITQNDFVRPSTVSGQSLLAGL